MHRLTPRQRQIFDFIVEHQERHGRTPTGPEIARHCGFGDRSTAYQHLRQIAAKGHLEIEQTGRNRPLRITVAEQFRARAVPGWPRLGAVPAGPATPAEAEDAEIVHSLQDLIPDLREGDFLLDVEGPSMTDAGLIDGMIAVMRPGLPSRPGAICAVWVEGLGSTIKRVFQRGEMVELVPEHPDFEAQTYPAEQVHVQGVLVTSLMVRTPR